MPSLLASTSARGAEAALTARPRRARSCGVQDVAAVHRDDEWHPRVTRRTASPAGTAL